MPWPLGRPKPPTQAKLTPEQVLEIRRRFRDEGETQCRIAEDYGVTTSCVGAIVTGVTWRRLPGVWDPELDIYFTAKG